MYVDSLGTRIGAVGNYLTALFDGEPTIAAKLYRIRPGAEWTRTARGGIICNARPVTYIDHTTIADTDRRRIVGINPRT